MIEVKDVNLTIKKHEILKGITCSFDYGTITGLVGNNGCGKTMLMKCICGFIRPNSGQVLFDGKRIGKDTDYLRHAGIIIETPRFIDYYSGMKNLKVLCGLSGKPDVAKLKETLSMCGLDPELRISVRKYSLGMRQRLALAQAIMEDQKVLILDEPFNGLDKHGIAEMRTLLLKLKEKGHLIILSSHNAEDVKLLCDHVIEMENGVILRAGK